MENLTVLDAMKQLKRATTMDSCNYSTAKSYRQDAKTRTKQKKEVIKLLKTLQLSDWDELATGYSGRCKVENNEMTFIVGGYAPTECYKHFLDYLISTYLNDEYYTMGVIADDQLESLKQEFRAIF